jgi:hypothetical protein
MASGGMSRLLSHSMRAYYLPLVAGVLLASSAFMPWTLIGNQRLGGVPDVSGLWVLGLGVLAAVLAGLSVLTRRNSRHPLLLVGLTAFAIVLLTERLIERSVADQVWARSQARAIVAGEQEPVPRPDPTMAPGAYLGLSAASVIVLFGMTIVLKQVAKPYAEPDDDDA